MRRLSGSHQQTLGLSVEVVRLNGLAFSLILFLLAACSSTAHSQDTVELDLVAGGLNRPLGLVDAEDGSARLFVIEQGGRVRVILDGAVLAQPFLDLSNAVSCCGERGLLGLAFHPSYATNGFFFVNYTADNGDTVVSRFTVSAGDLNHADPDSEIEILRLDQPFSNHNGGHLAFGPDGYLYVATGDGGSGGDPQNNGQDLGTLLGKILRLDVDDGSAAIPPDNPFVSTPNARGEIWAYGLRNPWRFSFDRKTGDLFIGDVGQNQIEEIDFQPAASDGGEHYGWRLKEGSRCFSPSSGCDDGSLTDPILEYRHAEGCSVTGGFRYRGPQQTLQGVYVFGDYCSGTLWGGTLNGDGTWSRRVLAETDLNIASFGEDADGNLYVVDLSGSVFRLSTKEIVANGFETGIFGWKKRGTAAIVAPGLGGTAFALAVMAGSFKRTFVKTKAPDRETTTSVSFLVNPSELEQLTLEEDILHLADGKGEHVVLTLEQLTSKRFRVALYVDEDSGRRLVGRVKIRARKTTRLAIEWARASAAGLADGSASLIKKSRARAAVADLANGQRVVNIFKAGLPLASKNSTGRLIFDEFVLSR
jgi:hypothetical protein